MTKRQFILLAIVLFLLIVAVVVYLIFTGKLFNSVNNNVGSTEPIIKVKEVNLSSSELQLFTDRLAQANKMRQELPQDASPLAKRDVLVYRAAQLYGLGRLDEARQDYILAVQAAPEDYNVKLGLFEVYNEMSDYKMAEAAIVEAIRLAPLRPEHWRRYLAFKQDKLRASPAELDSLYKQALQKTYSHVDIIALYARFLESIGNLAGASDQWREALKQSPDNKLYQQELERLRQ